MSLSGIIALKLKNSKELKKSYLDSWGARTMDDEYILMHGGTEYDIASYAHSNGACNYAVDGSYCEFCKKGKK